MEVAASLVGKAAQLQVVEREELPYLLTLGGQVGTVAMKVGKGKRSHSNSGRRGPQGHLHIDQSF